MKWRDIFIGAFVTLVITVIGGVIVWYVTKEPKNIPHEEKLVFQVDSPAKFKSSKTKLSFYQVRIANIGNKPAHDITSSIKFKKPSKIIDKNVVFSTGDAAGGYEAELTGDNNLVLKISTLVPNETSTLSIIVDTEQSVMPIVSVKSSNSIAVNSPIIYQQHNDAPEIKQSRIVSGIVAFVALVFQFVLIVRFRNAIGGPRSVNNAAFMYLHKGLIDEAKEMLQEKIKKDGATSYELANLGLCFGMSKNFEKSKKLLSAAEFYTSSGAGITSLVAFNRGIVAYKQGKIDKAKEYFITALEISQRRTKKYAKFSDIMNEIYEENQEIREIFAN